MTNSPECCSAESLDLNEEDILPCPFCGNPPKVEMTGFHLGGRTIRCEADDCMGPHTTATCVNDAVAQWNKRTGDVAQSAQVTEQQIEDGAKALFGDGWDKTATPANRRYCREKAKAIFAAMAAQPPAAPVETNDLVKRLREQATSTDSIFSRAADEIERLSRCSADNADVHNRPETPHWERRWPHDQPNGWNRDADKFLALIKSAGGSMWLALFRAKYLEMRIDTRDCGFNLYDRDGKPLNPDDVVKAVEEVKEKYGAGVSYRDEPQGAGK